VGNLYKMNLRDSVKLILEELYTQYIANQDDEKAPYLGVNSFGLSWDGTMTRDEAESALSYLASKELINLKESPFTGGNIKYHITLKGISYFLNEDYKRDLGWINRSLLRYHALPIKEIIVAVLLVITFIMGFGESCCGK